VSENSLLNRAGVSTTFAGSPRFSVGDHVRISARFPVGHYRTPMFLLQKQILTPDEIARRTAEVEARFSEEAEIH
jgi:hypothetical protein